MSIGLIFNQRVLPVVLFRISSKLYHSSWRRSANLIALINLLVFRVEIPARAIIGEGLVLPHPGGIVLGSASIGNNVTIFQNVTIGARVFEPDYDFDKRPVIRSGVTIGTGAVLLGPITIGESATIAANSLVISSVPLGCTAMGVPAAVRNIDYDERHP